MNQLLRSAIAGDLAAARAAVEAGEDIESVEPLHGNTALMLAAYNDHPEIVAFLLANGADVNARCRERNTALMKAAWSGAVEPVRRLIAAGADVDATEVNGMTALMFAAFHGRLEVVKVLAAAGASIAATDSDGYTAIRNAQSRGHEEIAEYLTERLREGLQESSMNFDMRDIEPFLDAVARHIESGFGAREVRKLVREMKRLDLDAEKSWAFQVTFRGRIVPLMISTFMDDVDAPDITVWTPPDLASLVDEELARFMR